jgi:hypothetical protein
MGAWRLDLLLPQPGQCKHNKRRFPSHNHPRSLRSRTRARSLSLSLSLSCSLSQQHTKCLFAAHQSRVIAYSQRRALLCASVFISARANLQFAPISYANYELVNEPELILISAYTCDTLASHARAFLRNASHANLPGTYTEAHQNESLTSSDS